ncbi:glycosyltransferase family 4 protein, partial [Escherichia coli]|nr:glycosyltransferase family 4 protein [Escherichia coli]
MIKIAHIQLLPMLSGVQRVCLDELSRLDKKKYQRYLICKEPGKLSDEATAIGVQCIFLPELQRNISFKMDLIALYKLYRIIKIYKFDIVHTHSSKPGVLGRIAARLNGVKLILHTVHGFSFPAAQNRFQYYIFWIMEKIGSICGDKLICLHKDDAVIAQEKLFIHKNKISIIENGVDTNKFKKRNNNEIDKLSTYFNIDRNSDVVVGMIGRLWPQKNPMLLLYAAKNIINNNKRVKFLFVGDGELKDSMNDYIIQNKLTQNITICGWCNDVSSYLNIFDIFVLPSLWEGMPLAILEAESSSLPCIVSNIPGNRSIIRHTVDGYLFSLDNPSELESYINILIEDKERRIILGNNARVKILESYK